MIEAGGRITAPIVSKVLAPWAKQYEKNRGIDEIAKERGVTLDPHEVLQSRPLALGHKVLENVPFTSGMVQRNELKKLESLTKAWQETRDKVGAPDRERLGEIGTKIQDQIEKHLDHLGVRQGEIRNKMRDEVLQATGSPLTYKELGETTQQAITQKYEGLKAIENAAWDYAREAVPEGKRVITKNLAQVGKKTIKDYENFPSFLDEPLTKQLSDVQKSGNPNYDKLLATIPEGLPPHVQQKLITDIAKGEQPGWTVESLLKLRSELSQMIDAHHTGAQQFGNLKQGSMDQYGRIYLNLKQAIDKDLQAFAETEGSEMMNRFAMARVASGERLSFFNPKENPWVVKAIRAEAPVLEQSLIKPGNASAYTELKKTIGDTAVQPVKQAFTNRLLGVGSKEEGGLAGLRTTLDRYGKQTLAEVYSDTEIKQLYELADKSNWMKKSPIGNPFFREMVKTAPARVAPSILEHPTETAKVLRQFPNMRQPLRQAFVEGVHPNERTPFPTRLIDTLNAYPKEVQNQLFTQGELRDFHELAKVIERTKGTVKLAENPSGTAQNLVTFTTAGALLKHPLANAPQAIATAAIAKAYLSGQGRKLLLEGLVTPQTAKKGAELGTKLSGILIHDKYDQQQQKRTKQRFYLGGQAGVQPAP